MLIFIAEYKKEATLWECSSILNDILMNNGQRFEFKSRVLINPYVVGSNPTSGATGAGGNRLHHLTRKLQDAS